MCFGVLKIRDLVYIKTCLL